MQRARIAALASLVTLLLAARDAGGQVIMGRVVDAGSGAPIVKAAVHVRVARDSVVRAKTGSDGVFALGLPGAGRFVVVVQPAFRVEVVTDSLQVGPGEVLEREFRVAVPPDAIPSEWQVDRAVAPVPDARGPRYPAHLKETNVEGEVLVSFVVDSAGRADAGTLRVLYETHPDFSVAVRDALAVMRFRPAEVAGRRVASGVEQPFSFCLTGGAGKPKEACSTLPPRPPSPR